MPIAAAIVAQAFEEGVLLNAPRPDALRFMPALNVTREEIAPMIDCLDAILTKIGRGEAGGVAASKPSLRSDAKQSIAAGKLDCFHGCAPRNDKATGRPCRTYGFKIEAPVVARLSRSICAFAASFSA